MVKKKRKYGNNGLHVVIVSSIIALNLIGINYANWNGSMEIENSLLTGDINPSFCDYYNLDETKGNGDISVRIDNDQTMSIQGKVEPGFKANLDYYIKNDGSIPAKLIEKTIDDTDGISIKVKQSSGVLEPQEYNHGKDDEGNIRIKASDEGKFNFEIELVYRQWEH